MENPLLRGLESNRVLTQTINKNFVLVDVITSDSGSDTERGSEEEEGSDDDVKILSEKKASDPGGTRAVKPKSDDGKKKARAPTSPTTSKPPLPRSSSSSLSATAEPSFDEGMGPTSAAAAASHSAPQVRTARKDFSTQQKSRHLDQVIAKITRRLRVTSTAPSDNHGEALPPPQQVPRSQSRQTQPLSKAKALTHAATKKLVRFQAAETSQPPNHNPQQRSQHPPAKKSTAIPKEGSKAHLQTRKEVDTAASQKEEESFESILDEPEETPTSPVLISNKQTRKTAPHRYQGTELPPESPPSLTGPSSPWSPGGDDGGSPPPLSARIRKIEARDSDNDGDNIVFPPHRKHQRIGAEAEDRDRTRATDEIPPVIGEDTSVRKLTIPDYFHPVQLNHQLRPELWKAGLRTSQDGFVGSGKLADLLARPLSTVFGPKPGKTVNLFGGNFPVHTTELEGCPVPLMEGLFAWLSKRLAKITTKVRGLEIEVPPALAFLVDYVHGYLTFCPGAQVVTMVGCLCKGMREVLDVVPRLAGLSSGGASTRALELMLQVHATFSEVTFRLAQIRVDHSENFDATLPDDPMLQLAETIVERICHLCLFTQVLDQELTFARRSLVMETIPSH